MAASDSSLVSPYPTYPAYPLNNSALHQTIVTVFFTPLIVIIIVGNTLVIVSVWRESALKSPRYFILSSLALCDLCNGLIATPLELYSRLVQNDTTCSLANSGYFSIWPYMFTVTSGTHLLLVTVDRHLAITRPLHYITMVTTFRMLVAIGLVWMFGIAYGVVYLINASKTSDSIKQLCSGIRYTGSSKKTFHVASGALLLLAGLNLFIVNLRILGIARRQARRIFHIPAVAQPRDNPRPPARIEKSTHLKATWTILLIVGTSFVCWLPTSAWLISRSFIDIPHIGQIVFMEIAFFFTNLGSALNPFIYCFKDQLFRRSFYKIIPKLKNYTYPCGSG